MRYLKRKIVENAEKPQGYWGRKTMRSMNKSHSDLTDWGLSFLHIKEDDAILDIGCGGGRTVQKLASLTKGYICGVDHAATAVTQSLRVNLKNVKKGRVVITKASVSALPFAPNTFTKVTAIETIYFWPDLTNDLHEISRIMKKGGHLLIVTEARADSPNVRQWAEIQRQIGLKIPSAPALAKELKAAGFHQIEAHIRGEWLAVTAEK